MRTLLIVAGAVVASGAVIVLLVKVAVRSLRKYVRALWPHS